MSKKVCTTCGHGTPVQAPPQASRTPKAPRAPSNKHTAEMAKKALARVRKGLR